MPLNWNGRVVDTWLVVYRTDPGSGLGSAGNECGRLWVCKDGPKDGTVLKQQMTVARSTLTFIRTPDEEALRLATKAGDGR
jgi:hypothetical protein